MTTHVQERVPRNSFPIGTIATLSLLVLATSAPFQAQADGHLPSEAGFSEETHAEAPPPDTTTDNATTEAIISESGDEEAHFADDPPESGESFQDSGDLDTDIGALEEDLMNLNMELRILEEDILYPASSRVAVYLAMDTGQLFQLDSVTLKLNNKEVSHHLYTERQVAALHQGGVQRLYVGNARQGDNELTAVFIGKGPEGRDYTRATAVDFDHGFEPIFIQLSIMDDRKTQQPGFSAEVVR